MIYIDSVTLCNFQSYHGKEYKYTFANGLNSICSPDNSAGKSTVFKSFMVMVNEKLVSKKSLRQSYISWGYHKSTALIEFSDKTKAGFTLTEKDIVYSFTYEDGTTIYDCNPIEETLSRMGILIDKESGFIANIRDNNQGYLLINTGSSTDNKFIELILRNQYLDDMLNSAENKLQAIDIILTKLNAKRNNYAYLAETMKYIDLNTLEYRKEVLDKCLPVFEGFMNTLGVIESLEEVGDTSKPYDELTIALDFASTLNSIKDSINDIEIEGETVDYKLLIETLNLSKSISNIRHTVDSIQPEIDIDVLDTMSNIYNLYKSIDSIEIPKDTIDVDLVSMSLDVGESIKSLFKSISDIEIVKENPIDILKTLQISEDINSIISLIRESYNLSKQIQKSEDIISKYKEDLVIEGKEFTCGIHGKIIFKDGKCFPINH